MYKKANRWRLKENQQREKGKEKESKKKQVQTRYWKINYKNIQVNMESKKKKIRKIQQKDK